MIRVTISHTTRARHPVILPEKTWIDHHDHDGLNSPRPINKKSHHPVLLLLGGYSLNDLVQREQ